jgi:hypothetical protein
MGLKTTAADMNCCAEITPSAPCISVDGRSVQRVRAARGERVTRTARSGFPSPRKLAAGDAALGLPA